MIAIDQAQLARWPLRRDIPRVSRISRDEFERRFIIGDDGLGVPAIVTDAFDTWPCRNWTIDMFRDRFADLLIRCYARSSRVRPYDTVGYELSMGEYIDYCRNGNQRQPPSGAKAITPRTDLYDGVGSLYWYENFARPEFQALIDDFKVDFYFIDNLQAHLRGDWKKFTLFLPFANLFVGGPGTCVDLHKDYWNTHTLILQLEGRKHAMIFSPHERARLKNAADEPIDPRHVDAAAYPDFEGAVVYEGTLEPGETLFMPPNWYHDVLGLTPSLSLGLNIVTIHNFGEYLPNLLSYPLQLFDALANHPTLASELHDRDGRPLERPARASGGSQ
jgi:hypothetical protein